MSSEKFVPESTGVDPSDISTQSFRARVHEFCVRYYGPEFNLPFLESETNDGLFDELANKVLNPLGVPGIKYDSDLPAAFDTIDEIPERLRRLADIKVLANPDSIDKKKERYNQSLDCYMRLAILAARDVNILMTHLAIVGSCLEQTQDRWVAEQVFTIWSTLAGLLGYEELQRQMEELAFHATKPAGYDGVVSVYERKFGTGNYLEEFDVEVSLIQEHLERALFDSGYQVTITARQKTFYSIWQKSAQHGTPDEISWDFLGLRIVVNHKEGLPVVNEMCYAIGDELRKIYGEPTYLKNYIANPKDSGYKTLHQCHEIRFTDSPGPIIFEAQIRTNEMHEQIEGQPMVHRAYVASKIQYGRYFRQHHAGKEDGRPDKMLDWRWRFVDQLERGRTEFLKEDILGKSQLVFTNRGYVYQLDGPRGPGGLKYPEGYPGDSVIDCAYKIHSHRANFIDFIWVNDQIVPMNYILKHGDVIRIKYHGRNLDDISTWHDSTFSCKESWLDYANSTSVKGDIRRSLRRHNEQAFIDTGVDSVNRLLEARHCPERISAQTVPDQFMGSTIECGYREFLRAVGDGTYKPDRLADRFTQASASESRGKLTDIPIYSLVINGEVYSGHRYADCCKIYEPSESSLAPPDVPLVTTARGRGFTLHHASCSNLISTAQSTIYPVSWKLTGYRRVRIVQKRADPLLGPRTIARHTK